MDLLGVTDRFFLLCVGEWYSGACIGDKHVAVTVATTPRAAISILTLGLRISQ